MAKNPQSGSAGDEDRHVGRDFLIMVVGTTLSFLAMYASGWHHRPDVANPADLTVFVWPLQSASFWMNAAFICLGLPFFHFIYTYPAYFVRKWLGIILRVFLKLVLLTFPYFILNSKVAYVVRTPDGAYLVQNNGTRVDLPGMTYEPSGDGLRSHVFAFKRYRYYTFAYLKTELPPLPSQDGWTQVEKGSQQP